MIEVGQYIKIIFKNATQVEGILEKWTDEEIILISSDSSNRIILFNPKENMLGVKICYDEPKKKIVQQKFSEVVEQFKKVQEEPSVDDLRLQKLADLKQLMNEQEKKIIIEKVKSHTISNVEFSKYGNPLSILRSK